MLENLRQRIGILSSSKGNSPGRSKLTATRSFLDPRRAIPLWTIVLLAFAIHGPLMLMQLPANSYDTNFNIFFASHYAHHWFNPWNEK